MGNQKSQISDDGFELTNTSGRHATLWFSKVGDITIRYHRAIPDEADIKEVTLKKETTGEWFVSFGLETDEADLPEKPDVDSLDTSNSVGIDLGILNYIHTSDGKTVDWLDLEDEYERLQREQRKLSRKEKGSNNYEKQRREVASDTQPTPPSSKRAERASANPHGHSRSCRHCWTTDGGIPPLKGWEEVKGDHHEWLQGLMLSANPTRVHSEDTWKNTVRKHKRRIETRNLTLTETV